LFTYTGSGASSNPTGLDPSLGPSVLAASATGSTLIAIATAGGSTYTALVESPGVIAVAGTALTVGGAAVTLSNGDILSAAASGLEIDGTVVSFSEATAVSSSPSVDTLETLGISVYTTSVSGQATVVTVEGSTRATGDTGVPSAGFRSSSAGILDGAASSSTAAGTLPSTATAVASRYAPSTYLIGILMMVLLTS